MDWRGEGQDRRGLDAQCQRSGSMDRRMMGTEDLEEALRIIMDEEEQPGSRRSR